ncbi:MAG: hypothetical protein IK073_07470 [Paludibacteraceae bacterium]|nr:hypothetical protein [Paludibacteraceae bacterium]
MTQDIYIQSRPDGTAAEADNAVIREMEAQIEAIMQQTTNGQHQRLHLILRSQRLADILRRTPLSAEMSERIELYAYTREDLWSMQLLGISPDSPTRLDRQPITPESRQIVHLVVFGMSPQTESLAIHTALIAHYPNYSLDHTLRTRITLVADSQEDFRAFRQHYQNLLTHSYRRTVLTGGEEVECLTQTPKYQGLRQDFVDIEFEFVNAHSDDDSLSYKLQKWAQDPSQQLTVAFCYTDASRNLNEALSLPQHLQDIPCWVRLDDDSSLRLVKQSGQYAQLIPFGMDHAPLPDMRRFIHMAQCVNYAYHQLRETSDEEQRQGQNAMAIATEVPSQQQLDQLWLNPRLTMPKRWSNIYHAFTLTSKMHSLGHAPETWRTLFAISEKEADLLSEAEHNRWSVEELILGYRPTTDEEHLAILRDIHQRGLLKSRLIHDDLRSYHELGVDETGKNVARYDLALTRTLPLIAYTYYHLNNPDA